MVVGRRFVISVLLLLLTVAVRAVSQDELVRIKQNYATLLIPSEKDSFGLKTVLSALQPEAEMSDQAVVELHQRYPFDLKKLERYLSTLGNDGRWPDINYEDKKRSGWEPKSHAERILELVKLYQSRQTDYYHSSQVEEAVHRALDYWFTAEPRCLNWWYNQIGVPKTLGTAFVLFEERLTPKEKEKAIKVMENAKFGMTGQNKVWLAGNVMMRALLQNDADLARMARDTIVSEIVTGGREGIKDDWSFHQHGAQQQFGNYGLSFVSGMSFFSNVFSGTSLAFDKQQLEIINSLIDKGFRWVLWKGKMDISSLGRQLFHHSQIHKALSLAFAAAELGGGECEESGRIARTLLQENYGDNQQISLTGHKHFWQSDYTVHRTPRWMASVKMASSRVTGVESMNGDNMKGYYMADGATYVYQQGNEYLDIFPLWDWRRIPGVTAFLSDEEMPQIRSYQPRNKAAFVGGVSNGQIGVSAMEVDRAGIRAHKVWIMTDRFLLCMGAGIQADSTLTVATSIEQCHKADELWMWNGKRWQKNTGVQENVGKEQRYHHAGKGYIVWGNQLQCTSSVALRSGRWHDVMQMYRPQEVNGEVFSLYIGHGVAPQGASYQYLILPDADKEQVSSFNLSDIRLIRNDESLQAVYSRQDDTWWIVAYQPERVRLSSNYMLQLQHPGIYMIRREGKKCHIWCTDPTQELESLGIELNGRQISVPVAGQSGQTVHALLKF